MPFIGNLIKTALDLNNQWRSLPEDAEKAQRDQLLYLLSRAQTTAFGRYYGFEPLLRSDDPIAAYQAQVPIFDYHKMNDQWWSRQQLYPSITWPGQPKYFALSSGTTGKESKRIPVTDHMLASFRAVGQSQIASLANFDLPADFFEKDVLMLSSSADLTPHKKHLEGEISGINSLNIPNWFDRFYKPGKDIAQIPEWEDRVEAIAQAAPNWDVVAIAGIPSWVRMMLKHIIDKHGLRNIHELWPHLSIYASGGVAFEPHRAGFEALLDHPIHVMDTYLASEGFFSFTARPNTLHMQLAIEHGMFYEFIPFDERGFDESGQLLPDPTVLHLGRVEADKDYALLASTPAGAWRYFIGDTIKFTDLDRYEMVISGRTKYFLNVVGSQLSEEKLNAGIQSLARSRERTISEFAVAALKENGSFVHQWVLGLDEPQGLQAEDLAHELDTILREMNKNYGVARDKALREVRARLVPTQRLYDWLDARKKKGGQVKFPKVMTEEKMRDLLGFLEV